VNSLHGMVLRLYLVIIVAICLSSDLGMVQSFINIAIRVNTFRHHLCYQKLALFSTSAWLPDYSAYKKDFETVTDDQWDKLEALSLKLYDWNTKVNLVSRKDVEFLIPNHIVPCLAMSLIRKFGKGETVIDVGTGGGLPGLPLAIICPDAHFTLLDSNSKKMMVVNEIANSLGLNNVNVVCSRAEKLNDKFDFLLGRAVSALPNFLSFSSHLIDGKSRTLPKDFVRKSPSESTGSDSSSVSISSGMLYLKGMLSCIVTCGSSVLILMKIVFIIFRWRLFRRTERERNCKSSLIFCI
jgi:16S rRNA (guanine527-N7)-methyltransferase